MRRSPEVPQTSDDPNIEPTKAGEGFWDGDLDSETTRHLAHNEAEVTHRQKIEELGKKEMEARGSDYPKMTPEEEKNEVRRLGDEVFNKMKMDELREARAQKEREDEAREKERKRQEMFQNIRDQQPLGKIKKWFRDNWIPWGQ